MTLSVVIYPGDCALANSDVRTGYKRMGATVVLASEWEDVRSLAEHSESFGLVLADLEALVRLWAPHDLAAWFRQPASQVDAPARLPAGCHVVAVRSQQCPEMEPEWVLGLHAWGVRDILPFKELLNALTRERLVTRAVVGALGERLSDAFLERVEPQVRTEAGEILDATLLGAYCGTWSVDELATRLFMAPSTLRRRMLRAGLITPSRFMQRVRVILAILLRSDPAQRAWAWKRLGFSSPGHLSRKARSYFGRALTQLERSKLEVLLPELVDTLLEESRR